MKKLLTAMAATFMLAALLCASASAMFGDVTIADAPAFSDPQMTLRIGTIPKYTSLAVYNFDTYTAYVTVNGVDCFVNPFTLSIAHYNYRYKGWSVLAGGATVYQRPTNASRGVRIGSPRKVLVVGVKGDWVLVRANYTGWFGFVKRDGLRGFVPMS